MLKQRALCDLSFPSWVCSQSRGKYHTHGKSRATEANTVEFHFYAVPVRAAVLALSSSSLLLESCFLSPSFHCVLGAGLSPRPSGCHPNLWRQAQATRNRKSRC